MEEIDVAIFAFDSEHKLRLVNRAGEKILAKPAERLTGRSAEELDLAECLEGDPARILQATFPSGPGRWGMRRSMFREHGLPMQLVVIGDLTRPLREEELAAWQRLVRVLGHELNNSLTPIKSIAGSLENLVTRETLPPDWQDDMRRGLAVISSRSESLSRFIGAYARLAKLPRPTLAPLEVAPWVRRVVGWRHGFTWTSSLDLNW
jgi:nitrogen fixation/metabolism regulation signal transduction histidine kinase